MTLNILLDKKEQKKNLELVDLIKEYKANYNAVVLAYCKALERSSWALTYGYKLKNGVGWSVAKPYALKCTEKYIKRLQK